MSALDLAALQKPFPASEIEWRVGSTNGEKTKGLALAYLTARHVMERLDEVAGVGNWQDRYEFHGPRTVCYLSLRVGDEWITKADGAGDSDVEAEKGAISDALKRAAVKWGIGRYLYNTGNIWVEIEPAGRSFRIKREEYARLEAALVRQFGEGDSARSVPTIQRLSAYRATQLMKQDVILDSIDKLKSAKGLDDMERTIRIDLGFLPLQWEELFLDRIAERRKALETGEPMPPTAAERANAQLDQIYQETMRQ